MGIASRKEQKNENRKMQCSYPKWASIFFPPTFKSSSFQSRFSVAPPQTRTEGSSDHNNVASGDNFGSDDDILPVISDVKSKLITSATNPFVKHCIKLRNDSSYRRSHGSVVVVGSTPIRFVDMLTQSISNYLLILVSKSERRPTLMSYIFLSFLCFFKYSKLITLSGLVCSKSILLNNRAFLFIGLFCSLTLLVN